MREILFRGKDIVGNWYAGNLSVIKQDFHNGAGTIKAGSYISNECGKPFAYQVRQETVGQFTGITDKNGKKIFEGDICSYYTPEYNDGKHFYKAERETGEVRINTRGVVFGGWQYTTPFGGCVSVIEVIGNIYDNPELLT